jgi:SAM-dependent methyltransferase
MALLRSTSCPCCGTEGGSWFQWALTSTFLSQRALDGQVTPTRLFECEACQHRWSERGLSDDEAARLYTGYRGDAYYELRHRSEPWYTRAINDGIGSETEMATRRALMSRLLAEAGAGARQFDTVIDWGGDRGQMLKDLPARRKLVHEVSKVQPDPGVENIERLTDFVGTADLVLNCHVLEHINEPLTGLAEAASLLKPGGLLYLELPYEPWRGPYLPAALSAPWLKLLAMTKWPLLAADFFSTAARIKLHTLPPFGFVAIREHLNFFGVQSVRKLVERGGLVPLICVQPNDTTLVAIARKRSASDV